MSQEVDVLGKRISSRDRSKPPADQSQRPLAKWKDRWPQAALFHATIAAYPRVCPAGRTVSIRKNVPSMQIIHHPREKPPSPGSH